MFLEKHWLTILLSAVLLCVAANSKADSKEDILDSFPYMYEVKELTGFNKPTIYRWYDSESDVVCYGLSTKTGIACSPNSSDRLRTKYRETYKNAKARADLRKELGQ